MASHHSKHEAIKNPTLDSNRETQPNTYGIFESSKVFQKSEIRLLNENVNIW